MDEKKQCNIKEEEESKKKRELFFQNEGENSGNQKKSDLYNRQTFLKLTKTIESLKKKESKYESLVGNLGLLGETNSKLIEQYIKERKERELLENHIKSLEQQLGKLKRKEEEAKSFMDGSTDIWKEIENEYHQNRLEIELDKLEGGSEDTSEKKKEDSDEEETEEDDSVEDSEDDFYEESEEEEEEFTPEERVLALDEYLLKQRGIPFKNKPKNFRHTLYQSWISDEKPYWMDLSTKLCIEKRYQKKRKKKSHKTKEMLTKNALDLVQLGKFAPTEFFKDFTGNYEKVVGLLDVAKQTVGKLEGEVVDVKEKIKTEEGKVKEEQKRGDRAMERAIEEAKKKNSTLGNYLTCYNIVKTECATVLGVVITLGLVGGYIYSFFK